VCQRISAFDPTLQRAAGASIDGIDLPTGYAEIDALLVRAN
jgi:hypothetical protein